MSKISKEAQENGTTEHTKKKGLYKIGDVKERMEGGVRVAEIRPYGAPESIINLYFLGNLLEDNR